MFSSVLRRLVSLLGLGCPYVVNRVPISVQYTSDANVTNLKLSEFKIFQQDATYSVYYFSVGSSTCFGC